MSTPTTKPKTAKPSKTQRLEAELKAAQARIQKAEADLASHVEILRRRDESEKETAREIEAARGKISALLAVLRPFHVKTIPWGERWPADGIALRDKLTYGELRAARDAYVAHS